jgi:two-component system, chemotaxis family, response regulator Rcp1
VGGRLVVEGPAKTVLMADDDPEDCWPATKAFAEGGATAAFSCVLDGIELMNHLKETSRSEAKRLPDLILLDLNTPRKDGWQALIETKAEPALQDIPPHLNCQAQIPRNPTGSF